MGPQVLPGASSKVGFPRGYSLLRASTCSGLGSSMGSRWRSAPLWTFMGCWGTACLTMVFSMGCRGISAPAPGAPPPRPFSSLTLVSSYLFVSPDGKCCYTWYFSFLNMLSQRCCHCHWLAQPWAAVGPSWNQLVFPLSDIGEASSSFSQKPTLYLPLLPKPCHANPVHMFILLY